MYVCVRVCVLIFDTYHRDTLHLWQQECGKSVVFSRSDEGVREQKGLATLL